MGEFSRYGRNCIPTKFEGLFYSNASVKRRFLIALGVIAALALVLAMIVAYPAPRLRYQGKSVKAWAKLAHSGDGNAVAALKAMGTNAVPELIGLLQTKEPWLRRQVWSFQGKAPMGLRRKLLSKVGFPDAADLRAAAATSLGIIGTNARPAVPFLAQTLQDPAHQTCYEASAAMARIGKASVPFLIEALGNTDPNRRRSFVSALGQIGPDAEAAVPALIETLKDPDQTVRSYAAFALGSIGTPWVRSLTEVIANGDANGRATAAKELQLISRGPVQAAKALMEMANDPAAETRRQAIETLGIIRPPHARVIAVFSEALKDPDRAVRLAAAKALGAMGQRAKSATPELTRALEDNDESVRIEAKETLAKLGRDSDK
jgi:HEAT repeat protein